MIRRLAFLVSLCFLLGGGTAMAQEQESAAAFDALWDYDDPAATHARFLELLPRAIESGDSSLHAQILTQIARCQGLQRKFDEAHATLDQAEALLYRALVTARVRVLLERGRVHNSSGEPERARPLFLQALELAKEHGEEFHAVDAAHMLGIIDPPERALEWNRAAIEMAERSDDERARNWLGSLLNNVGWTLHDMGDYEAALAMFEKAVAFREERGAAGPLRIARWAVARAHRSLGRLDEALAEQRKLAGEYEAAGQPDGYVQEEIGECLLLLGRPEEARPHFARAHEILSKDPWLAENAADRIARLKELAEGTGEGSAR